MLELSTYIFQNIIVSFAFFEFTSVIHTVLINSSHFYLYFQDKGAGTLNFFNIFDTYILVSSKLSR